MTKRLESLFNLPEDQSEIATEISEEVETVTVVNETIDKIDNALPSVKKLDASDKEMDDLALKATETFDEIMALGMNVEPRHSGKLFEVASSMLGHAITAKTAKLDKKLKMVELQLKKAKLDQDSGKKEDLEEGKGTILDRNELLKQLLDQNKS